jgi:hypothetical protein
MTRRFAPVLVIALGLPATLQTQSDSSSTIRGSARSSFNGRALAGVMISVPARRAFTVTDSTGRFELRRLPSGKQLVRVSYEGRSTEEYELDLPRGKTKSISILLDVEALDLDPIVVEVQHRDFARNLAGFYDRRSMYSGFARFFTREDLERDRVSDLSQVLVLDGVVTQCGAHGCVPIRWARGSMCPVTVAVDGMPFWERDYETIPLNDVEAVEVYRSGVASSWGAAPTATTVVAGQSQPSAVGCGSVMIWTR